MKKLKLRSRAISWRSALGSTTSLNKSLLLLYHMQLLALARGLKRLRKSDRSLRLCLSRGQRQIPSCRTFAVSIQEHLFLVPIPEHIRLQQFPCETVSINLSEFLQAIFPNRMAGRLTSSTSIFSHDHVPISRSRSLAARCCCKTAYRIRLIHMHT